MSELQSKIQALTEDYGKIQQDLQKTVASRQKLEGQKQENTSVQQEFEALEEGETIYKVVGPVLMKQEKFEAESTVKGRLDFITGEISRLEDQIKASQEMAEKKKTEILQLSAQAQAATAGQAK